MRPGQAVLLYQRQNVDIVVGMIAALRLAAPWCVVDVAHPVRAVHTLLADLPCGAVVFDGADPVTPPAAVTDLVASVPAASPALIDLAGPAERDHAGVEPDAAPAGLPDGAPAYLITTSGSTGEPKAVMVSRASLAGMVAGRYYDFRDGELVTFAALRFTWDGSFLLLFWALSVGGTNVLPDDRQLSNVEAVADLAERWHASHLVFTPSYYRMLLPRLTGLVEHARTVVLAGEALPVALVEQHRDTLPRTRLYNEYGPTETTVICLAYHVAGRPRASVPIGRPTRGCSAHVLDERLRPVPPGTVGELYIGGWQVSLGYAARPGATAERFVADPFTDLPGARLYRTGDLALVDQDGELEFHGRVDAQLKVRGVRVERREIELVLESHPAVGQAVVLEIADAHGETGLAAFWSPAGDAGVLPGVRELHGFCAERLLAQAVPELFIPIGKVPLAASGKADEAALRAMLPGTEADGAGAGPAVLSKHEWDPVQRAVGELWAEVLRHDDFGLADRFFSVGGSSKRLVELHLRFQQRWPGAVRVAQLFELPTVEQQAVLLARRTGNSAAAANPEPAAFEV